jgi:hypothetical protein
VTAPTPSQPDPDRPRGSHRYDGRRGRSRHDGRQDPRHQGDSSANGGSGPPYGEQGQYGSQGQSGGQDQYGGQGPYGDYGQHQQHGHQHGQPPQYGEQGSNGWNGGPAASWQAYPYPEGADRMSADVRREVREGAVCALIVTVLGVGLGLLWLWLAPRVPLITVDNSVFLKDPEGEEAVGADGTFVLLAIGFGVVTGLLAFLRSRAGGVGIVVGLAVGALLGSVVAWRLGIWLGPSSDLVASAKAAGPGKTFDGPLKLQAKSALLVWPALGLLTHLLLTGLFGKREPEPGAPEFPSKGMGGGPPQGW